MYIVTMRYSEGVEGFVHISSNDGCSIHKAIVELSGGERPKYRLCSKTDYEKLYVNTERCESYTLYKVKVIC